MAHLSRKCHPINPFNNMLSQLLLSWQSGCFQYQTSALWIQSSVNFYTEHIFTFNCMEIQKLIKQRPGRGHFQKNLNFSWSRLVRSYVTHFLRPWDESGLWNVPIRASPWPNGWNLTSYVKHFADLGSGCGSVGRTVTSDSRGPHFSMANDIWCFSLRKKIKIWFVSCVWLTRRWAISTIKFFCTSAEITVTCYHNSNLYVVI